MQEFGVRAIYVAKTRCVSVCHWDLTNKQTKEKVKEEIFVSCKVKVKGIQKRQIRQMLLNAGLKGEVMKFEIDNNGVAVNEISMEGETTRVNAVVHAMDKNLTEKPKYDKWECKYFGVVVPLTNETLKNKDKSSSSGDGRFNEHKQEIGKKSASKSNTSNRSTHSQKKFSTNLHLRDRVCRVHRNKKDCRGILQGAHLFPPNHERTPRYILDNSLVNSNVNGYYWCRHFEDEWHANTVVIDPLTGYLVFSDEFDFHHCNIDKNQKYKISDLKELNFKSMEPTQQMLKVCFGRFFLSLSSFYRTTAYVLNPDFM